MTTLLSLMILWAIVTLLGHGTWIAIAAVARATRTPSQRSKVNETPVAQPNPATDSPAFARMLDGLAATGRIAPAHADRLKMEARRLVQSMADDVSVKPTAPDVQSLGTEMSPHQSPPRSESETVATGPSMEFIRRPVEEFVGSKSTALPSPAPTRARVPKPSRPLTETITAFLADHNIRWGEIVAGLMILVCSVGLVVSLWNTFTQTHRVVPSIIFIGADAAIFAAGLYTTRRWKLRHTSRTVLIIATLLIPLCVLAGLAAARAGTDSVHLSDPTTLLVIVVGFLGCTYLLFQGGRELVGRGQAIAWSLLVAAPTVTLPLLPTLHRLLGSTASWSLIVPSVVVAGALLWRHRRRSSQERRFTGPRFGKGQLWMVAVATSSMACLQVYAAMHLVDGLETPDDRASVWIRIALASIPFWSAMVVTAISNAKLASKRHRAHTGWIASILAFMAGGVLVCLLIPSMRHWQWLWLHASIVSISLGAALTWIGLRRWVIPSVVASLALVACWTAPSWLGGMLWMDVGIWHCLGSVESMAVAAVIALLFGWLALALTPDRGRLEMMGLAGGLAVWAALQAIVLSFGPTERHGTLGLVGLVAVLLISWLTSTLLAMRRSQAAWMTPIAWTSLMSGVTRWLVISTSGATIHWDGLPWIALVVGVACLATAVLVRHRRRILSRWNIGRARIANATARWLEIVSGLMMVSASCIVIVLNVSRTRTDAWTGHEFWPATYLISFATFITWAVAWIQRDNRWRRISQLGSFMAILFMMTAIGAPAIWELDSWSSAESWWQLGGACMMATAIWIVVDRIPNSGVGHAVDRFDWLLPLSTGFMCVGALQGAAMVWLSPMGALGAGDAASALPRLIDGLNPQPMSIIEVAATALMLLGMVAAWRFKRIGVRWNLKDAALHLTTHRSNPTADPSTGSAIGWMSLWMTLATQIALSSSDDPTWRLIVMMTLPLSIALFAETSWTQAAVTLWIGLGSATLMLSQWWPDIAQGDAPGFTTTMVNSLWWCVLALIVGRKSVDGLQDSSSTWRQLLPAILLPAAVTILVPAVFDVSVWVWFQAGALGCLLHLAWQRWIRPIRSLWHAGSYLSVTWVALLATVSCVAAIAEPLRTGNLNGSWTLPVGGVLSLLGMGILTWVIRSDPQDRRWPIQWMGPIWMVLMSGHVAGWVVACGWLPQSDWSLALGGMWLAGSLLAVVMHLRWPNTGVGWLGVATTALIVAATFWTSTGLGRDHAATWRIMSLISLAGVGLVSVYMPVRRRPLQWAVLVAGSWFCLGIETLSFIETGWPAVPVWIAKWIVVWRSALTGDADHQGTSSWASRSADREAVLLLCLGSPCVWLVAVDSLTSTSKIGFASVGIGPLLIAVFACLLASISVIWSPNRRWTWTPAVALGSMSVGCIGAITWTICASNPSLRILVAVTLLSMIASVGCLGVGANTIQRLCELVHPASDRVANGPRLADAIRRNLGSITVLCGAWAIVLWNDPSNSEPWAMAMVLGVFANAAALFVLSERGGEVSEDHRMTLRHQCVITGLCAVALLAIVSRPISAGWLVCVMRCWMASVVSTAVLVLVIPSSLAEPFVQKWKPVLERGGWITGIASIVLLAGVFVGELGVHQDGGIAEVSLPLVVAVALMMGTLAMLLTIVIVLSGPLGSGSAIQLMPSQRNWGLHLAQGIAAATWLHVFLCRPDFAAVGIRQAWPYVVMVIAFASVGVTQWAKRMGDDAIASVMQRTALFLPLIPVTGFWLSGSAVTPEVSSWRFTQDGTSYSTVLLVAAAGYAFMSWMWRQGLPRVATAALANAALWVWLAQNPGWGFLSHPQAWLIPPAGCVLLLTHLHRNRLQESLVKSVRYAVTLVIYIVSTADMLITDIGPSLWGPVILILLALLGMAAGAALRVRPFLYLGATFVFLGVISMVWHAGRAIDAVWPWWVFGITTGLLLLVGFAMLERERPRVNRWLQHLATWES
ncbi:MAG: hypothetical protein AAGJ40_10550 [Planctomycetota bacterium]